jgi:hypothetical protein
MTLVELTKLDAKLGEGTLVAALEDGTINQRTQRKDVVAMWQKPPLVRATDIDDDEPTASYDELAAEHESLQALVGELEAARETAPPVDEELYELRRLNEALTSENEELKAQVAELQAKLSEREAA